MISRRSIVIGGVAAMAVAGVGWRAWDRGVVGADEGPAYQPWRDWQGGAEEGLARPLHAAILAANPHDTQPWIFAAGPDGIAVMADRARNLGSFDPFRREMHLGLGAAIENLTSAARACGLRAETTATAGRLAPSPDDAPFLAARLAFHPTSSEPDLFFAAIPRRHTDRGPYRPDALISRRALDRLVELAATEDVRVVFLTDLAARRELGAVIVEATERIVGDPEMAADSAKWFRAGRREVEAHRDGVTLDAAGLSPAMTALAKLMPDMSSQSNDAYWLSMTRDVQAPTASALGVVFVRDRLDMAGAIAAGAAWQRLHLAATAAGLAAQPLNQPVERADRDAALGRPGGFDKALAAFAPAPGWEATFVFRLGRPDRPAPPSPRRALAEVMRLTT